MGRKGPFCKGVGTAAWKGHAVSPGEGKGPLGRSLLALSRRSLRRYRSLSADCFADRGCVDPESAGDLVQVAVGVCGPLATDVGQERDVEQQAHTPGRIELGNVFLDGFKDLGAAGLFGFRIATDSFGQVNPVFVRNVAG